MYRKHERGSQISRVLITLLVIGCGVPLFARNNKKVVVHRPVQSADYEKTIREKNEVLDSIKNELDKGREKLRQLQTREGTVVAQLAQVEDNIATSENYLHRVSGKMDSLSRSISRLSGRLDSATRELSERQEVMKKRLRAMYEAGPVSPVATHHYLAERVRHAQPGSILQRFEPVRPAPLG